MSFWGGKFYETKSKTLGGAGRGAVGGGAAGREAPHADEPLGEAHYMGQRSADRTWPNTSAGILVGRSSTTRGSAARSYIACCFSSQMMARPSTSRGARLRTPCRRQVPHHPLEDPLYPGSPLPYRMTSTSLSPRNRLGHRLSSGHRRG
jgi:hypothetical protein